MPRPGGRADVPLGRFTTRPKRHFLNRSGSRDNGGLPRALLKLVRGFARRQLHDDVVANVNDFEVSARVEGDDVALAVPCRETTKSPGRAPGLPQAPQSSSQASCGRVTLASWLHKDPLAIGRDFDEFGQGRNFDAFQLELFAR